MNKPPTVSEIKLKTFFSQLEAWFKSLYQTGNFIYLKWKREKYKRRN